MLLRSVVLPLPRNPVMTCEGVNKCGMQGFAQAMGRQHKGCGVGCTMLSKNEKMPKRGFQCSSTP